MELINDKRNIRRHLDDAEDKLNEVDKKIETEKKEEEKCDKYISEIRERVKVEELEREKIRNEIKRRRESERDFMEFQEYKGESIHRMTLYCQYPCNFK